ncbi:MULTISPECIES: hypothetical protein [unclassified Streptomyces]|uniref:hypothetical protein n=1 Tax=unclassified Streptomyces TaxID=2593676 RepID=UPI002253B7D3|nr:MULTISPECIES: hypothetical protein [unclassified Streptomyces]WSP55235.1 hypothetical protein OG306_13185 [Streptomyces sp. NBC_01241]MCX4786908.1 hypothetical protein [Streptomyces sp. NBC_01221]MCX4797324.1 hypothetical protein [Streptomyces sp. NBC_01242]WSJ38613.1 hypothetical protein OG772_23115 [Streptomyces sp. NBC_01321]WSP64902.1 hypothetical protein OG466_25730 [Streptomyces sp. NBC_01240]
MRSIPLTFCAAAVVAAALMPASAALADSDTGTDRGTGSGSRTALSVSPPSLAPGGAVDLRLDSCGGKEAKGNSDAFVSEARFSPAADGGLFAEARIGTDASPGDHEIQVVCTDDKGTKVSGTVTVVGRGQASPLAPVRAGGGGTAARTDREAHQEGPGIVHAVIGLVLAAVAAVAVGFRSARRRRPAAD